MLATFVGFILSSQLNLLSLHYYYSVGRAECKFDDYKGPINEIIYEKVGNMRNKSLQKVQPKSEGGPCSQSNKNI